MLSSPPLPPGRALSIINYSLLMVVFFQAVFEAHHLHFQSSFSWFSSCDIIVTYLGLITGIFILPLVYFLQAGSWWRFWVSSFSFFIYDLKFHALRNLDWKSSRPSPSCSWKSSTLPGEKAMVGGNEWKNEIVSEWMNETSAPPGKKNRWKWMNEWMN